MTFVRQTPGTDDELVRWLDLIKISPRVHFYIRVSHFENCYGK